MRNSTDPYDLQRFTTGQEGIYQKALNEIAGGRKRGHWMWFMFPQIFGLGRTSCSLRYAIKSVDEARAYLDHELLGPRLIEAFRTANAVRDRTALEIFGHTDTMKLRSSATLFDAAGDSQVFRETLDKYFAGEPDQLTLDILADPPF